MWNRLQFITRCGAVWAQLQRAPTTCGSTVIVYTRLSGHCLPLVSKDGTTMLHWKSHNTKIFYPRQVFTSICANDSSLTTKLLNKHKQGSASQAWSPQEATDLSLHKTTCKYNCTMCGRANPLSMFLCRYLLKQKRLLTKKNMLSLQEQWAHMHVTPAQLCLLHVEPREFGALVQVFSEQSRSKAITLTGHFIRYTCSNAC